MTSQCIVHYEGISIHNPHSLQELNEKTFASLIESKIIRQKLGGENLHPKQCAGVPVNLDNKTYHYHSECFKKFTYAKTLAKRKDNTLNQHEKRPKRCKSEVVANERGIFGDICMLCKKRQIKIGQKYHYPKPIITLAAASNLKQAAEKCNDAALLLQISEVDLVAKEFKNHEKCYRDYTRILYDNTQNVTRINNKGDFAAVCRVIDDEVLRSGKCVSMSLLINVYGIGKDQHQYRSYLKERLTKFYGENICFGK